MAIAMSFALSASPVRPHIALVLADDLGHANVDWNVRGSPPEGPLTPNLHAIARDGIVLERAYGYMLCGPSRSGE